MATDPEYRAPDVKRVLLAGMLVLLAGPAAARDKDQYFNIPSQAADASLREFARQSGSQILFSYSLTAGRTAPALQGRYQPAAAMALLADALGLRAIQVDARTVALSPAEPADPIVEPLATPENSRELRTLVAKEPRAPLEEVIVTAQKRPEAVQLVPVAIDVVSADTLAREVIREIKDLQKVSTELEIDFSAGQATAIGLRGLQQNGYAPTDDTLVAVHLDGAYLSSFWGLNGLMFDLERVEVVAGPQGTLYGRNTAAGAVNLISRRPDREFSANASLEYGSGNTVRLDAGVSIPLSDTFAVRLAGQQFSRDALFTDGSSAEDQWGVRLSGSWAPDADNELHVTADFADLAGTTNAATLFAVNENARLADGSIPVSVSAYLDSPTLGDPYNNLPYLTQRNLDFFGRNHQTNRGVMAEYVHHFQSISATLQYSHRKVEGVSRYPTKTVSQFSGGLMPNVVTSDTAEFRLASSLEGPLEWVAGIFYMQAENLGWNATPLADNSPDPVTGADVAWCPCSSGFYPNSGNMYSYAAFGQATWTPPAAERLHATAGIRYTFDWKDATLGYWATTAQGPLPIVAFGIPDMQPEVRALFAGVPDIANGDNERTWDGIQYRFGLEYQINKTSMVYGSVATGYKSGGLTYGSTPVLKPEALLAYEIGTKNRFFDNTLEVNAAAWWYDDSDLEGNVQRPLGFSFLLPNGTYQDSAPSTASVGKVHLAGFSTDIDWNLSGRDSVGLSLAYVYSRIDTGSEHSGSGTVTTVFNEGERIGDAPEWQILGRYGHVFTLRSGALLQPLVKYRWQSSKYDAGLYREQAYYTGHMNPQESEIPARGILDFSLRFTPPAANWDLTGYVLNATDELDVRSLAYVANPANAATTYGHTMATLGEPRSVGMIMNVRFR